MKNRKLFFLILLLFPMLVQAQEEHKSNGIIIDYDSPKKYIIGGIDVSGIKYLGKDQIISLTGLRAGDEVTVPSEALSSIVKRIWMQRFFSDVALYVDSLSLNRDTAFFRLELQERPRGSRGSFKGVKKDRK